MALVVVDDTGLDLGREVRRHLEKSKRIQLRSPRHTAEPPSIPEACEVGRRLEADYVVILIASAAAKENVRCVRSEILSKTSKCATYARTGTFSAHATVQLDIVDVATCQQSHSFTVTGSTESGSDEDVAASAAFHDLRGKLARLVPLTFPLGARITRTDGTVGHVDRGRDDGFARGQFFGIFHGDRWVGHAVVREVADSSATVEAFTGDAVLHEGDVLAESGMTCCLELQPMFTTLRSDVAGNRHLAAGAGVQVALYRPLSSFLVSSTLSLVNAGDDVATILWTVDAGWIWRLAPRGLSLYALVGGGVADSHLSGARAGGFVVNAGLGLRLHLTDNFWLTGEGAWLAGTRMDNWSGPPEGMPYVDLAAPLVRLGVGLRIP